MIYYAYFHSHMAHMCFAWGNAKQLLINKLRVLQNAAIKTVLKVDGLFPTKLVYQIPNVLPFDLLVKIKLVSILNNHIQLRKCLNSPLVFNHQVHEYGTRAAAEFHIPTIQSTHYGNLSILYYAITVYNSIPDAVKRITVLTKFKKDVKNLYLQNFLDE